MEQYWSGGGADNPYFRHKIIVSRLNDKMIEWCLDYVSDSRFYIVYLLRTDGVQFQFESEEPAIMFNLKFGGPIK
jgi:hypothetical protein